MVICKASGNARKAALVFLVSNSLLGFAACPSFAQTAAAPAAPRLVDINEYDVEGNTLLSGVEVSRAVYPYEGPQRPVSDTERARAALQKAYEDRGYQAVVVQLPPQSVKNGVVLIKVIEARVGRVTVSGAQYATDREVRREIPSVEEGNVPDFKAFNKDLARLNSRSADLQVTPQLKPGTLPDTIDVDLAVDDKRPVHGDLELNNNYSRDTHELRLQAQASYDDLWHMGHSISGFYDVAPQNRDDAEVYVLTYSAPIPETNLRLSLTGLKSNSDVTTVGSTGVLGEGQSVTLNLYAPLPALKGYSQSLTAGFAYKHFRDTVSVPGQSSATPITYYPFSLAYTGSWRGDADLVQLTGAVNFAFRGLGSPADAFDAKRARAFGNFIYFHGQASVEHDLPLSAKLYLEADGQLSNEPLISNEQFSAGGNGSVRGYLQAEALGDNGLHGSIELRSPDLAPRIDKSGFLSSLKFLAFADVGQTWLQSPLPEQQDKATLVSVGPALRSKIKFINFDGDVGFPLKSTDTSDLGHPRFQFRLYTQF